MKKLLHERLRNWAKEYPYSQLTAANDLGCSPYEHIDSVFLAIADEIEKYYIPRPRFEDGEPVQFGEEFADYSGNPHTLHEIRYRDKAAAGLGAKCLLEANTTSPKDYDGISFNLYDGTFVKRPEPKVLDAEGAPCKKGETVWRLIDSTKWEITDIHPTEPRIAVRQLDTEKEVVGGWFLAEEYSHREPDSLKKAVNDLGELLNFPMCDDIKLDKVEEVYNRLTAIMERDA